MTALSVAAASAVWRAALAAAGCPSRLPTETVDLERALGRVAAAPVTAVRSSPAVPCAAMDGIAVLAADTVSGLVDPACVDVVDTGDPLPAGRDAVVMREHVVRRPDGRLQLEAPARSGQHVRQVGESVLAGEQVVAPGRVLSPADLAAAATGGHRSVEVGRRPVVAIVPTGDEVRPLGADLEPGELVDTNSLMLAGTLRQAGARTRVAPVQPDDPTVIAAAVRRAAEEADLVLVLAGSSAGRDDHATAVIRSLGSLVVQGVAVRPAHPVLLGVLHGQPAVPVVGVPGYPVSAALAVELFVVPLLADLERRSPRPRRSVVARLAAPVASRPDWEEYVLVELADGCAHPLPRGSAAQMALARADGVLRIAADSAGYADGDPVEVDLLDGPGWAARSATVTAVPV